MPTAGHPACSWEKVPPSNQDEVCRTLWNTVETLLSASTSGRQTVVRDIVRSPRVARKVIAYGVYARQKRLQQLHAVPSITIDIPVRGVYGVYFDIRGKTRDGTNYKAGETIYMRIRGKRPIVFDDQAGQEW